MGRRRSVPHFGIQKCRCAGRRACLELGIEISKLLLKFHSQGSLMSGRVRIRAFAECTCRERSAVAF